MGGRTPCNSWLNIDRQNNGNTQQSEHIQVKCLEEIVFTTDDHALFIVEPYFNLIKIFHSIFLNRISITNDALSYNNHDIVQGIILIMLFLLELFEIVLCIVEK